MSRRATTPQEKELLFNIFKTGDYSKTSDDDLTKLISVELLKINSNWSQSRISKWISNNKAAILDIMKNSTIQKVDPKEEKRMGFPQIYNTDTCTFTFSDCHLKANGEISGYYKCNNCNAHVIVCKNESGMFLTRPHSCSNALNHKEETELQATKNALLAKAEKIMQDDPSMGPHQCYALLMNYSHPGYEMRQRAVSKKEIISLRNSIGKIKCDIDMFIPPNAQLFKFDGVEHNFILFHQSSPFHILAFASKEQALQFKRGRKFFIDGTFRETPQDFKEGQLLNILVLHEETHVFIPVIHVLMDKRTEEAYDNMFKLIIMYAEQPNAEFVMTDFETALQNACAQYLKTDNVTGCFFHYTKAIHMTIKNMYISNETTEALFDFFKDFPFIYSENRNDIIKWMWDNGSDELKVFLKYYADQWLNNPALNYQNDDIKTNNGCESFHSELSSKFPFDHPKIEALANALWNLYISRKANVEFFTKNPGMVKDGSNYKPAKIEALIDRAKYLMRMLKDRGLILSKPKGVISYPSSLPQGSDEAVIKMSSNIMFN